MRYSVNLKNQQTTTNNAHYGAHICGSTLHHTFFEMCNRESLIHNTYLERGEHPHYNLRSVESNYIYCSIFSQLPHVLIEMMMPICLAYLY